MRRWAAVLLLVAGPVAADDALVRVASKADTETTILAEIVVGLLRRDGIPVELKARLGGTRFVWDAMLRQYPDDLDASALFAEALMDQTPWNFYDNYGKPLHPATTEIVTTLESVLRRDPKHAWAIHLYIHATEASDNPVPCYLTVMVAHRR